MTLIKLFISLALPIFAGYALLNFILRRDRPNLSTSLGLSYGLGLGVLTHWMLFLDVIGIKYSVESIGIPLLIFSIFIFSLAFRKGKREQVSKIPGQSPATDKLTATTLHVKILLRVLYILLGLYVVYYLYYIFWRSLNIPVAAWDAVSSVAFKAKVFFYERCLFHLKDIPPHPAYPVHVPLAQMWVALNLGVWNDMLIKIVFPFATLSFVIIYNYFLASRTNRRWALLGTAMLISSNLLIHHSTIAYRDLFLLYYDCTAIILLLIWLNKKNDGFLILASLYAGFATFIKLEGTPYLLICTALFFLVLLHQKTDSVRKNIIKFLKFTIPSFGICLFFYLYKILEKFPLPREKSHIDFTWEHLRRITIILKSFSNDLFLSGNWDIIWFLLVLSLALNFSKIKKMIEVRLLLTTLVMFFGLYFLLSLFTTEFIYISGTKSSTGLSRLILHFFPLAPLLIILLNYPGESRLSTDSLKTLKKRHKR